MACGFRFTWTNDDLPGGGGVQVFDDHSTITVLCHEPSFRDDPEWWVTELEAHLGAEAAARTEALRMLRAG